MNIRNRYEKKSIRGKDKKRAIYFFKSLVAIILSVLLAFPASLIYKDTVNAETKKARYTVLLLDVSDVENFYYMVYDNPLWAQFGLSYKGHEEVFTSDSHVDLVKEAAAQFLRCSVYSFDSNYIAIVSYTEEATVVCDFTDDVELLLSKLYEIECVPESDRCIKNGLECAENLLNGIESTNVQKIFCYAPLGLQIQEIIRKKENIMRIQQDQHGRIWNRRFVYINMPILP